MLYRCLIRCLFNIKKNPQRKENYQSLTKNGAMFVMSDHPSEAKI